MTRSPTNTWLTLAVLAGLLLVLLVVGQSSIASRSFAVIRKLADPKVNTDTLPSLTVSPGDLDPSFGQSGRMTISFFGSSAFAYAGALQADGRIIGAGGNSTTKGFSLARFLADGTLDNSFGTAGRVTTAFNAGNDFAFAQAVQVQTDGKIVAGGLANNASGVTEFALARYMPSGPLDSSFGSSGKVTTSISGLSAQVRAQRRRVWWSRLHLPRS